MGKRRSKITQFALFIAVVIIGVAYFTYIKIESNAFNKQKICSNLILKISGEDNVDFITKEDIRKILNKNHLHPVGRFVINIKTKQIEDLLKKQSVIRDVQCYKTPNGDVVIDIEQRNILFRVLGETNYYIDDECKRMPVSNKYTAYVPIVTGFVTQEMIENKMYDFMMYLKEDDFWNNQIVQINVNKKKEVELIPRVGDYIFKLGNLNHYKSKLSKLETFYKKGLAQIGWKKYHVIDARFKHQVVCH